MQTEHHGIHRDNVAILERETEINTDTLGKIGRLLWKFPQAG